MNVLVLKLDIPNLSYSLLKLAVEVAQLLYVMNMVSVDWLCGSLKNTSLVQLLLQLCL